MNSLLLDTHVWIWYVNGSNELKKSSHNMITSGLYNNEVCLAAISLWEIDMLENKQRITLEMPCLEWINRFINLTHIRVMPLTPAIATESCNLPGKFHDDPADRMITATARVEGLKLVTRDARILSYGKNKHISTIKV